MHRPRRPYGGQSDRVVRRLPDLLDGSARGAAQGLPDVPSIGGGAAPPSDGRGRWNLSLSYSYEIYNTATLPNGTVLAPFLRLPWMHDFLPDRNVPRYFSALPEDVFSGMGTPSVANAAVIHIGATGNLVYRW